MAPNNHLRRAIACGGKYRRLADLSRLYVFYNFGVYVMTKVDDDEREQKFLNSFYLSYWKEFFFEFFGWSETRVIKWARQYKNDMLDSPWFLHDGPHAPTIYELIPTKLKNPTKIIDIRNSIYGLIPPGFDVKQDGNHHMYRNWSVYRSNVDNFLRSLGYSLQVIENQLNEKYPE